MKLVKGSGRIFEGKTGTVRFHEDFIVGIEYLSKREDFTVGTGPILTDPDSNGEWSPDLNILLNIKT